MSANTKFCVVCCKIATHSTLSCCVEAKNICSKCIVIIGEGNRPSKCPICRRSFEPNILLKLRGGTDIKFGQLC